ncbi:MAG TPA: ABC transporter permease [Thermoanaerobaculia bacterium]|jgi:predicted permease|nr:ABC transporter permease [Thermoanaerobaculia bacterium]
MLHDLRIAVRQLLRQPGLTAALIATLALGIGATTAIFSLINAVLLQPLPYPNPDRLVRIWGRFTQPDIPRLRASEKEVLDYQKNFGSFAAVAGFAYRDANLTAGDQPERVRVYYLTYQFWQVMGVKPVIGRTFDKADDQPGASPVVVISYGLWHRRFGGDPGILGKDVQLNLTPRAVIGVMPQGFSFPDKAEVWAPFGIDPANLPPRQVHYLEVIARMIPGVSIEQAKAAVRAQTRRWPKLWAGVYPDDGGWDTDVISLLEQEIGDVRPALFTLLGAVGFVLLITCANVGSMLLVRVEGRSREILVRSALGAGRRALVRQFMLESLILSAIGGVLGLFAASWAIRAVVLLFPTAIPRAQGVGLDARVMAFAFGVTLITSLFVSLLPAWHGSRPDLSQSLKEASATTQGAGKQLSHRLLVVLQVALAIALLIGAGLLISSFFRLQNEAVGFTSQGVLSMQISLPRARYPDGGAQTAGFFADLDRRLASERGIAAAGVITHLPLGGTNFTATLVGEGRPTGVDAAQPEPGLRSVTPGYFSALRIPVLKGRAFSDSDDAHAPLVAILDQRLAANLWPGKEALGRRVHRGPPDGGEADFPWRTVVGVVGNVRDDGPTALPSTEGNVYFPMAQEPDRGVYLAVRAAQGDPAKLAGTVRAAVRAIDHDQPVGDVATMDQRLADVLARPRLSAILLASFGGLALLLAAVGIYSVVAQMVVRRTGEIGLRMALGADRGTILALLAKRGLGLVAIGVALGLGLALALTRLISKLLYGVVGGSLLTYLSVCGLLVAVSLVAVLWPARRASRLDPIIALRQE